MERVGLHETAVYHLSEGKTLPEFLEEARKKSKSLKNDQAYRRRAELLQDFHFTGASSRVKIAEGGQFLAASGAYPPEIKMFDVENMGMKFGRRLDAEVEDFLFLGPGYEKFVMGMSDRSIEFHSQFGKHFRVRVPKLPRALAYDWERTCLHVGVTGSEIYRLDLEEGCFVPPLTTSWAEGGVADLALVPRWPLLCAVGDGGALEAWDLRSDQSVARLAVTNAALTTLAVSQDGMRLTCGDTSGTVRTFDLRSHKPLCSRDLLNGLPVRALNMVEANSVHEELVAAADSSGVKIWRPTRGEGELFTAFDTPAPVNNLAFWPDSGLLLGAIEQPRVGAWFIPKLGVAPQWCSFLDAMTEEFEEKREDTVYDDYRFITQSQVQQIGAGALVGTNMLKAHLHGFLIDNRLYRKLCDAAEPFAYEAYRKRKLNERLESKRGMRQPVRRKVKVNAKLLAELEGKMTENPNASRKAKKSAEAAQAVLEDERFTKLFSHKDFQIE